MALRRNADRVRVFRRPAPLLVLTAVLCAPATGDQGGASDPPGLGAFAGKTIVAVEVRGHEVTREHVIRREIRSAVGTPLDLDVVDADQQRLDNLSVFAEILVSATAQGEGVLLTYTFKEMPAWVPWVGFSYTEADGFSAGPKVSALNLKGRAISLSARAYFGGAEQYAVRLAWPWIRGNHFSFEFDGARLNRYDTLNEFEETSYEFSPTVGTWFGEHGRLEGKLSLFQMKSDVPGKTLDPDDHDVLPRAGGSVGWDTRDSWRFPSRGWNNELAFWWTFGDGQFWTIDLDLRRFVRLGRTQRILVSSLTTLQTGTVGEDVPEYLMYRMGGANSIRGYSIEELGRTLYGKNQMIGTVEYSVNVVPLRRWDIWKFALRLGIDAAVFADAGIAWSEASELSMNRARGGMGFGLRLLVPGSEMVRFDLGWSPNGGVHFHFASGTKPFAQRQRLR